MRKLDYKKYLYPAVITVLVIFFVGGVVIGGASVMHMDGAYPPYEPDEAFAPLPETAGEAVDLLNGAIAQALTAAPKIKFVCDSSFDGDDISLTAKNGYEDLFKKYEGVFSSDDAEDKLEELYDKSYGVNGLAHEYETDYGDAGTCEVLLGGVAPELSEILSAESTDDRWVCSNCGESKNEPFDECEECKLTGAAEKRKRNTVCVTLTLASLPDFFPQRSVSQLDRLLNSEGFGSYVPTNITTEYPEVKLVFELDRADGRLRTLVFKAKTRLTASLETRTVPELSEYGDILLDCLFDDDIKYEITFPSISLNDAEPLRPGKTMTVAPGRTEAVKFSHQPNDRAVKIRWQSSDEGVLTVDEDGYVKAGKTPGEATVTATLTFEGRSCSDSVTVYVRKSVEKLNLNKYHLSLAVGGQYALRAQVSPRRATVRTVAWYSEDETIATVDENGVVTAISPGETVIYALSDDGFYKASCKTEVK